METYRNSYKKRIKILALTWKEEFELPDGSYYDYDLRLF